MKPSDNPRISEDIARMEQGNQPDGTTVIACPDCGGAIWELRNGDTKHRYYECRVGHRYSPESFLTEHDAAVERELWRAIRALEESG